MKKYFGKYRGKVINNFDPTNQGRVQVDVPAVPGKLNLAMPCVPYAGIQAGIYAVPQIGTNVWVEFEAGDPDHPILAGCFWGIGEAPAIGLATPAAVPHVAIYTSPMNGLMISSALGPTGGIALSTSSGAVLSINDAGILISNGKGATISLIGKAVDINQGALTALF